MKFIQGAPKARFLIIGTLGLVFAIVYFPRHLAQSKNQETQAVSTPQGEKAPKASGTSAEKNSGKQRLQAKLDQLPLYFIENQGQVDGPVAYYLQSPRGLTYFTSAGITLTQTRQNQNALILGENQGKGALREKTENIDRWVVKLDFVGANPDARIMGGDQAKAVVSYFKGSKKDWKAGLPTYGSVVYEELWPGIDLIYTGEGERLKATYVVKPGADPSVIRLSYQGPDEVAITQEGRLHISTPLGEFEEDRPYTFQENQGERVEVDAHFTLQNRSASGEFVYGFQLGEYDRTKTLFIDPVILTYCGYIGGSGSDYGNGIALDSSGNAYVTGYTESTEASFPVTAGPDLTFNGGATDVFVAKVNATGTSLSYCGYIGGSGSDYGNGIAVDSSGNAYIIGYTGSTEASFPVITGPDLIYNGNYDAFVAKVNATGTSLDYCGYIGGSAFEVGAGIAVDGSGNAYVVGFTLSTEASFPVTVGPDLTHSGDYDVFVAKVNATGTSLSYCGYIGGTNNDRGNGIALDSSGSAYVTGYTASTEASFPVTVGPDLTYNGDPNDAFVAKVNAAGTGLSYCGYIGGSGVDFGNGIAVDSSGNAYVIGYTGSTEASFPVIVGPDLTYNGGSIDAFVAKVNAAGTGLSYCGYIGGLGVDFGNGIAVDSSGNAYVIGATESSEVSFPVVVGPALTFKGNRDAFVAKVDAAGASLSYCGYIGGSDSDFGNGIAVDSSGNAYVIGYTGSTEASFPVTVGPDLTHGGSYDAFVARIEVVGPCVGQPAGTSCDDGLFCNGPDTCDGAESCANHSGDPCLGEAVCAQTCNEDNDTCQDPDGTPCPDGVGCTEEQCDGGVCRLTINHALCDDQIDCTVDTCDVILDCQHTPNHAACDDSISCTSDTCDLILGCQHTPNNSACDDGVDCSDDICDVVSGCFHGANNYLCPDDGLFCNGGESCDTQLGCIHGVSPCSASGLACDENTDKCVNCLQNQDCDDNVACTTDSCNSSTGNCVFIPDNGLCTDDGLFCSGSESCDSQQGCIHSGDPCAGQGTKCSESLDQCVHCLVAQDCDDGLYCNGAESCGNDGSCLPGTNPCDDNDACTLDTCDEGADECSHQPDPQCSDGKPVIACQPNLKATVGLGYQVDEDGKIEATGDLPITWSKLLGPDSFHVDPTTGVITWIPASSGQVQIQIQASNDQGNDTCTFAVQVAPEASGIPQAVMEINPEMGRVPLQVHLDGSSSIAPSGGSIVSYRWDFGDGSGWGYGAMQDHTFGSAGSFQVGLLVTEAGGSSGQAKGLVRVLSQDGKTPPVARIVASATEGEGSLTVEFDCACAIGSAPIVAYLWDFADQSQSDKEQVQHNFLVGRYEVKLTVVDGNGLSGTDRQEIVVTPAGSKKLPPVCQASGAPLSGVAPLGVSYIGFYADADGQVTQWKWYFGEQEVTGQANLSRTYSEPGIFDATFVVTDNDSLTCQSSVEVVVSQTPGKTPPKILSLPNKTAACNEPYQYDQDDKASARGDRPITWMLGKEINGETVGKPAGMEINAQTGEISWTPSDQQTGANRVTLIVSNDQGADVQEFEVEVTCDEQPSEGCGCSPNRETDSGWMKFLGMVWGIWLMRRRFLG